MKKVIVLILALSMILGAVGCSSAPAGEATSTPQPTEEATQTPEATPEAESTNEATPIEKASSWQYDFTVDDFGDPTDEKYMKASFEGSFSNTATTDSQLSVIIGYMNINYNTMNFSDYFVIRLLEYGRQPATYLDSDAITLKVKIDDVVYTQELYGKAPNGDLLLSNDVKVVGYADGNRPLGKLISNQLWEGNEVPCIIEIDGSKYSFTLIGSGFAELYDEWRNSLKNE